MGTCKNLKDVYIILNLYLFEFYLYYFFYEQLSSLILKESFKGQIYGLLNLCVYLHVKRLAPFVEFRKSPHPLEQPCFREGLLWEMPDSDTGHLHSTATLLLLDTVYCAQPLKLKNVTYQPQPVLVTFFKKPIFHLNAT